MTAPATSIIARANPGPQTSLLTCPAEDVFYGGARGGGKTWGLILDWISHASRYGFNARGIFFRKSYPELEEVELQCAVLLFPLGWRWLSQKRTWVAPNGATLKLRFLEREKDAELYQGHAYTWMAFDEAGNWPTPGPIDRLWGSLRSAAGVPVSRRLTGNPGGVGHNWLKARYIDAMPPFTPHKTYIKLTGDRTVSLTSVFIPAYLEDNPPLMQNDPGYEDRLAAAGPEWLYKAWRYGIWDIVAGGFFDDVWDRRVHVLRAFAFPRTWRLDRSFDWGSARPFSVGWWAETDGSDWVGQPRHFVKGSLVRIAEWYGMVEGEPNTGLRISAAEIGRGILEREKRWGLAGRVSRGPADPSIFTKEEGPSIAQSMASATQGRIQWLPGDNKPGSRKNRWQRVRQLLKNAYRKEDAGLFVFDTCTHFIRTVPILQRAEGEKGMEDIDTEQEDHIADELGYRAMNVKGRWIVGKHPV